ncbi:MAG: hypothetical protein ACC661_05440 [Verrucomicrobiales bacterium]
MTPLSLRRILGATLATASIALTLAPQRSEARRPVAHRRAPVAHRGVVAAPAVRGTARRTARRTTRRVARRRMHTLPAGYRMINYGAYRYYVVGGVYYYPYYVSGQPVYIEVDIDANGQPLPPPPANEIAY